MTDTAYQAIQSQLGYCLERVAHVMLGYPE